MAGLIPQSFIDELLNRVDIVEVIDRRVTLKKAGKEYKACCPFHSEKTPSFTVQPEKQFFYCFGCGAGGNAVKFVMNYQNLDFVEAVETIANEAGIEVPRETSPAQSRRSAEQRPLFECLEQANKFYRHQLRQHPQRGLAVDWCKSRGISGVTAREFQLGFAPSGRENPLLTALGVDERARNTLLKVGLIIAREAEKTGKSHNSRFYDRFWNRVIFPIRDGRGRTVGFGGRVLGDGTPKYLNSPETPVFEKGRELYGLYEARKHKFNKLLLVEGYMDVIALAQAGIRNVVATLGTATSEWQIQRMFRHVPEIVFSFDGDEAGQRAAWHALETSLPLMGDGKSARFLFLPEGEDPDSMVQKEGTEKFLERIENAQPLENFFFKHLSKDLNTKLFEGRATLSDRAMPLIRKLPEGTYRKLMIERLAEITGKETEALDKSHLLRRTSNESGDNLPNNKLLAIKYLIDLPKVALDNEEDLSPLLEVGDASEMCLAEMIEKVRENPDIDRYELMEYSYSNSEVRSQLTNVLTAEKIEPADAGKVKGEFLQILDESLARCAKKLRNRQLRDQLRARTAAKAHTED
ncbi:MAG: DNA primase [Gammaproteobacteria bacterium]|nr:DNA primase [Gammaproteobacteria bacterium]MYL14083.1 DNA primase [Gammaproteobacteria bacterium]